MNKYEALEIVESIDSGAKAEQLKDEKYLLESLKKNGSDIVVITDGEMGAWAYDGSAILHFPAILKKAVDTLGS